MGVINHIDSYDNLILMVVEIFFYATVLFSDIAPLWLLEVETQVVD